MPAATSHEDDYPTRVSSLMSASVSHLPDYFNSHFSLDQAALLAATRVAPGERPEAPKATQHQSSSSSSTSTCDQLSSSCTLPGELSKRLALEAARPSTRSSRASAPTESGERPASLSLFNFDEEEDADYDDRYADERDYERHYHSDNSEDLDQFEDSFSGAHLQQRAHPDHDSYLIGAYCPHALDAPQSGADMEPIMLIYNDSYLPSAAAAASTGSLPAPAASVGSASAASSECSDSQEERAHCLELQSPELLLAMTPPANRLDYYLSLEELKQMQSSCWLCGCHWLEDHLSLDCEECGGYAMQRPCPSCDGKCGQLWRRNLAATHDRHRARWQGKCRFQAAPAPAPTCDKTPRQPRGAEQ